jgi:hypothetical protein
MAPDTGGGIHCFDCPFVSPHVTAACGTLFCDSHRSKELRSARLYCLSDIGNSSQTWSKARFPILHASRGVMDGSGISTALAFDWDTAIWILGLHDDHTEKEDH